jgi:hypothetical protein
LPRASSSPATTFASVTRLRSISPSRAASASTRLTSLSSRCSVSLARHAKSAIASTHLRMARSYSDTRVSAKCVPECVGTRAARRRP